MHEILNNDHESLLGQSLQLRIRRFEWDGGSAYLRMRPETTRRPVWLVPHSLRIPLLTFKHRSDWVDLSSFHSDNKVYPMDMRKGDWKSRDWETVMTVQSRDGLIKNQNESLCNRIL